MSTPVAGLVDTSVLVGFEVDRPLRRALLPASMVLSVITIGELRAGVLAARDARVQGARMATLERALRITQLPVDRAVAAAWATMRVELGRAGRRININDLWIAATAAVHHLPLFTQDDDFDAIADLGGVEVVKV